MPERRLFFALWPDPEVRGALDTAGRVVLREVQGRHVPPANLHLTLAFLGETPQAAMPGVWEAASACPRPGPLDLVLDHAGHWDGPQVVWLGCNRVPALLLELVDALWAGLVPLGLRRDHESFRPHVTIARRARCQRLLPSPPAVFWHCESFYLMESVAGPAGPAYEPLERWPLIAPETDPAGRRTPDSME